MCMCICGASVRMLEKKFNLKEKKKKIIQKILILRDFLLA